jgi:hypothetical protein
VVSLFSITYTVYGKAGGGRLISIREVEWKGFCVEELEATS